MCEGAYCIVLFGKDIYTSDYDGAYDLIGGRLKEGETPPQALARELKEETSLGVDDILMMKDTGERIAFTSKRCTHSNKQEIHYLYVVRVGKKPESGDIKISRVSKSQLLGSIHYLNQKEALERIFGNEGI